MGAARLACLCVGYSYKDLLAGEVVQAVGPIKECCGQCYGCMEIILAPIGSTLGGMFCFKWRGVDAIVSYSL